MQELFFYLVKMTVCSMVLLLYYYLFLRNKAFHQYNRFYLLLAVVISFIFPLIKIPVIWQAGSGQPPLYIQTLDAITFTNHVNNTKSHILPYSSASVILLYLSVSVFILIQLIKSFALIRRLSHRYPSQQLHNISLYHTTEKNTPFSFMKKIFWNDKITIDSPEGSRIFRHELFHTQQMHSVDNVFMQLVLSVAWVNPFFHIIKKEIAAIHEFLADRYAIENADKYAYAEYLVVQAANQTNPVPVAHHFFNSPFKRRITMILHNSNRSRFSYVRKLFAIPVIALIFCSLAMRTNQQQASGYGSIRITADTTGPTVLTIIQQEPQPDAQFPGGAAAWQRYLIKNLHYPQAAQDLGVQGPVVVEFVVEKDGTTRDFKAISGPAKGGLQEEAIRVIQNSGKWIPGQVNGQTIVTTKRQPIIFKMETQKVIIKNSKS